MLHKCDTKLKTTIYSIKNSLTTTTYSDYKAMAGETRKAKIWYFSAKCIILTPF